jgi:hypothetical protein
MRASSIPLATRTPPAQPSPQAQGWAPLCSSKIYVISKRTLLTGDVRDKFTELSLLERAYFDRDGPIWIKARDDTPGFFDVAVLRSDPEHTTPQELVAFETRLLPLGIAMLARVINDDADALTEAGRFMLYQEEDLASATIYLARAHARGADVVIDLAVATLLAAAR